jgi:hypothetical protein
MQNSCFEPSQPGPESWQFVKELSRPLKPHFNWTRGAAEKNEADLGCGVVIRKNFPDPEGRLKTAYDDLDGFFRTAGLSLDGKYKIIIEKADTGCFESYKLDINSGECRILAGDTEGIRRALYYLEDLLLGADGPFLPLGVAERKPWMKSRISRCFFGPIKRPPLNRDELLDDVDYYPDEYLNRLAHEGLNGLWLTIAFSDLCRTSITELAPDAEKRLAKLRRTVEKCLRYGIKTYIFCIEPRSIAPDSELARKHPELKGAVAWDGKHCFCPSSDTAKNYLYEAVNWMFSQVPGLGGMINVSFGERVTTCASSFYGQDCPQCAKKSPGEIIAPTLEAMERGMHDASPDAELISWLYVPQNGPENDHSEEMVDVAAKLPGNIILQYNFESGGSKEQLGKPRHAGDYWLSYTGPSAIYARIAEKVLTGGNKISAKTQVACSHELATIPFIPAPGLLYRKYREMRRLGVSCVMQCWYFGNYPGIMNKAAGELAFENFADSEADFLLRLARPEWGKYAPQVVEAWGLLTDAYSNYPLDNMFQYYGPMHDGVVWPLYLVPEDKALAPTWRLDYGTSGDRYGECLGRFAFEDVLTLSAKIALDWGQGAGILCGLRDAFRDNPERLKDIDLTEALGILFESGYNILKFYSLRELLLDDDSGAWPDALVQMADIVKEEIKRSGRILELCESDSRLGFHSEAEGYKFFPAKLAWRIEQLQSLLEKDFPAVKDRIDKKQKPFAEKAAKTYVCNSGKMEKSGNFSWRVDYVDGKLQISVDGPDEYTVFVEDRAFCKPKQLTFRDKAEILISPTRSFVGFNIIRGGIDPNHPLPEYVGWETFKPRTIRLNLGTYDPKAKGKLILEEIK